MTRFHERAIRENQNEADRSLRRLETEKIWKGLKLFEKMWERFERTREGLKSLENVCLRRPEKALCRAKITGFPFFLIKRPLQEVQTMKFEERRRESNGSVRLLDEIS